MPTGVEVSIEDDTATVVFRDRTRWLANLGRLLGAADDPQQVRKVTFPEVAYIVPVEVARAAGFVDEPPRDHTGVTAEQGALPAGDTAPAGPDMTWSRPDLNTFAARLGVADAGKMRTKQEVLAAITAAL